MRAVNLIPREQRSGAPVGAGRSEGAAYAVMVVLGGFALLVFLYARANNQISSSRSQAAALAAQAQRTQAETSRLAPYTSFIALREQRTNAVSELVDSRFDWAHVFHEFGRVLPPEVSVSSLTGTIGGGGSGAGAASAAAPPPASASSTAAGASPAAQGSGAPAAVTVTSATPPGSVPQFTLTGCATSQPAVALMLERLRLMDGVSSVNLQNSTKGASSGGGGGGGGGCAAGQPAYNVQVTFDALPSTAAVRAGSRTTAVSARSGSAPGSTTGTGGAR
jgi:Tfp pilus assembly protein PilN